MSAIARVRGLPEGLVVLVAFFWGWTFVLIRDAVASYPVLPFVALRFALASVLIAPVAWRLRRAGTPRTIRRGVALGSVMLATYVLQTAGLARTSAANSGLITGLYVAWTAVLARVFLGEALSVRSGVGIAVAFVGLALLGGGLDPSWNRGDALTLGCAFTIAVHIVWTSRLTQGEDSTLLTALQLATVAVGAACLAGPGWQDAFPVPAAGVRALVVCAVLATVFAYWVQTEVQKSMQPVRLALLFLLEPAFALLCAVTLGREALGPDRWVGAGLLLAGIGLSESARLRRVAGPTGSR